MALKTPNVIHMCSLKCCIECTEMNSITNSVAYFSIKFSQRILNISIFSGCLVNTRNLLMKSTRHSSFMSRCWRRGRRRLWRTSSRPTPASRSRCLSTARRPRRRWTRSSRWRSSWSDWWSTPATARCWCSRSRLTPAYTSCWPSSQSWTWPAWLSWNLFPTFKQFRWGERGKRSNCNVMVL